MFITRQYFQFSGVSQFMCICSRKHIGKLKASETFKHLRRDSLIYGGSLIYGKGWTKLSQSGMMKKLVRSLVTFSLLR